MDLQESVDFVGAHLANQKVKSMKGISCAYLDKKGNKCAVGCLLPQDHKMMNYFSGVDDLIMRYDKDVPEVIRENVYLFDGLQCFHDTAFKRLRLNRLEILKEEFPKINFNKDYEKWCEYGELKL